VSFPDDGTEDLVSRAAAGESAARERLLMRHRDRLRHAIARRLDDRLAARVDASDIVQEAMADASRKLEDYLLQPPLPFFPWLRQLALERLIQARRRHVHAEKRSVALEQSIAVPDGASVAPPSDRFVASGDTPLASVVRAELRHTVQEVLRRLPEHDREILELRHMRQLSTRETAQLLHLSEGAVKTRHLRALRRFRRYMEGDVEEKR
jgi:RNA polymerase sigma-70 factor (ECF subfamily)